MAILLGLLFPYREDTLVKRPTVLLVAVLALVLAACGSDQTDATATPIPTPAATPTEAPTPEPTESEPAETPDATDDDDGSGTGSVITGELADALPDEVGGLTKQEVPGMEALIGPMLQQQGLNTDEADFAFVSYGDGDPAESLIVTAMRLPGVNEAQLEMLARMMSSNQAPGAGEVDTEEVTIGGKDVLRVSPADAEQSVLIYLVDGAFFSLISPSEELAEDLLSQLP